MSKITQSVFETYASSPRSALLMSGSGTNAEEILSDEEVRQLYDIDVIVTDNEDSNALQIGKRFQVPVLVSHREKFTGRIDRENYFDDLSFQLADRGVSATLYAGFMKIATSSFCTTFPGVNIHPADLTIADTTGQAKYRGMRALTEMRQDTGAVRSTVHIVDTPVDTGSAISLSRYAHFTDEHSDEEVHEILKHEEHKTYKATLIALGRGLLSVERLPYDIVEIERIIHE